MPTYTFKNKETNEVYDKFMSISQREEYLKSNPHIVQTIETAPALSGDSVGLGFRRNDGGFNDLMNRIGQANPGSAVAEKYTRKSAKQVKVDNVVKKHGLRKGGAD